MVAQPIQTNTIRRLIVALQHPRIEAVPVANPYEDWIATAPETTQARHYTWRFTHLCMVCGKEFQSAKSTSKCCGSGCRVKLCRSRKHVRKNMDKIQWSIGALQDMAESSDPVMVRKAREALASLRADITEACRESRV